MPPKGKRVCQIIKVKPEQLDAYKELHANAWPSVLSALSNAHFEDYSIHYDPLHSLLIAHFVYTGTDWDADMAAVARDEETRRWWKLTDAMQESLVEGAEGSGGSKPWWLDLEEVFRFEGGPANESTKT